MKRFRRILLNTLTALSLLLFAAAAGAWGRSHAKYDLLTERLGGSWGASLESCQDTCCLYVQTKLGQDQEDSWPRGWFTEPRPRDMPLLERGWLVWEPRSGALWYGGEDVHDGIFGLEIPYYVALISSPYCLSSALPCFGDAGLLEEQGDGGAR
jgi:hypothetical protein